MPGRRIPWTVHPEAVPLTGRDGGQIAVPDVAVDFVEVDPLLAAVLADKAQLDPLGNLGEQREVRACAVVGGAKGVARSRPDSRDRRRGRHQSTHQPVAAAIWRPSSAVIVRM